MRYKLFILLSLIFGIATAQPKQAEPYQLIVGIKIDGLQADHLQKMWKYFAPDGFKKIVTESVAVERMHHGVVSAGNAADAATVVSGTYPYFHGVAGNYYLDRKDNQVYSILNDKNQIGIGTRDKFSAHRLKASTFTDELILNNRLSQVHSIGINAEDAIMLGGHTATSVTWIDDIQQKWVTTGYYPKGLSRWADAMNADGTFKQYIAEKWTPSATVSTYINPTGAGSRTAPFSYSPADKQTGSTELPILKQTPAANALVTELAKTIFERESLGMDKHPDVLMVQYNVKIPGQLSSPLNTAEQEDMYSRLDRNIQSLLSVINTKVGADKVLVFVIGGASDVSSPAELGKNQIPSGFFNADRALALLNTYLMAIYGQEKWISGYYGKNIFLNRKKIEEKKIDISEFSDRVADFLLEFEGVQSAYPADYIVRFSGGETDVRTKLRNSYNKNTSGDIVLTLMPGWMEVDNKGRMVGEANAQQVFVPFYLIGKELKLQQREVYSTVDIAPTISNLLGIPVPNACVGSPIIE